MNQFFGTDYSQEDLQAQVQQRRRNASLRTMSMGPPAPQESPDTMDMSGGESLDDILQNNREIQRRQSLPMPYPGQEIDRQSSMMEFGNSNNNLNGYQFGQPTSTVGDPGLRRQSTGELDMVSGYADMSLGMNMQASQVGFSSAMQTSEPLTIDTSSFPGMSPNMVQGLMGYAPIGMDGISEEDQASMNMFSPNHFAQGFANSMEPIPDFMIPGNQQDPMSAHRESIHEEREEIVPRMSSIRASDSIVSSPANTKMAQSAVYTSPVTANMPPPPPSQDTPLRMPAVTSSATAPEIENATKAEPKSPNYKNIYSSSGFDMLGALMKVATRKNPEINIGKVDMSCAFVVCDITQADVPIIYASEIFERLTGYNKHEILGRNCRFLQSPEGKVQAGVRREFVDNDSVYYLRERISQKKEAQRSLINYRKGGQPFMNLLTMIPITGEDDEEIKYYVGFQVDLVEKPASVEGKNASGLYTVDYSQGMLPQYVWQPPDGTRRGDSGQTISRDDVSTVLSSINSSTESELAKRMWDKVLLENTDDVVHVLSLKGLFLYLSPSSRKVLEYDASELVGTALSSVCHPSDIVPVTRELKDTSTGTSVNVVFRIRRKKSGYTWFESHGSLSVEQGKGRKCIILVGRERPVYALARHDIDAAGGIGENEMWSKLSTSAMFLFASSNVLTLLDRAPEELIGTSFQALMRAESKIEFGRSLDKARTGKRVSYKHEIFNKRGVHLQAQTTLYPGDAAEGSKPTFLVAQTRLLKTSRSVAPALGSHGSSKSLNSTGRVDHHSEDSTPIGHLSAFSPLNQEGELAPRSSASLPGPITQAGGGLTIGSQDMALASEDNIFDELKTTRCTSWQFELRQMEKSNRVLAEELASLLSNKKKRKRRKGAGHLQRDCANCHTRVTPEWRRGPSGKRDLCNSCGLRWAKQTGRVLPRTSTRGGDSGSKASQHSTSTQQPSPLANEVQNTQSLSNTPNLNPAPKINSATNVNLVDGKGKGKDADANVAMTGTAVPGSLGGRTTAESMPVHKPSQGFREGGERGITKIDEEVGGAGAS